MTHGSLFSGIGGFDLAAEWMGWENIFHCEWMPFPRKILKYYFPNSISYENICTTDFTSHRGTIDILTGGFPCQPYSTAGKRLGKEDDRHLFPEMLRAIKEIQPSWIVGENVRGLTNWNGGLVFNEVQTDLEAEGYEVLPFLLPACAVNAPHRRDRIWFIAHSNNNGSSTRFGQVQGEDEEISQWNNDAKSCNTSNGDASDTMFMGLQYPKKIGNIQGGTRKAQIKGGKSSESIKTNGSNGDASDTTSIGLCGNSSTEQSQFKTFGTQDRMDTENASDTTSNGRGENNRIRNPKFFDKNREIGNWQNFPTVPPICSGDDGISDRLDSITFSKWRNESIKGGGNAIVPQVVLQIFKAIEQYEQLKQRE